MDGLQPITALVTQLASPWLPEYDWFRHHRLGQSERFDTNKSDKPAGWSFWRLPFFFPLCTFIPLYSLSSLSLSRSDWFLVQMKDLRVSMNVQSVCTFSERQITALIWNPVLKKKAFIKVLSKEGYHLVIQKLIWNSFSKMNICAFTVSPFMQLMNAVALKTESAAHLNECNWNTEYLWHWQRNCG